MMPISLACSSGGAFPYLGGLDLKLDSIGREVETVEIIGLEGSAKQTTSPRHVGTSDTLAMYVLYLAMQPSPLGWSEAEVGW